MSERRVPIQLCLSAHAWLTRVSDATIDQDNIIAHPCRCAVCGSTKTVLRWPDGHVHSRAVQKSLAFATLCAAIPVHQRRRYVYEYLTREIGNA